MGNPYAPPSGDRTRDGGGPTRDDQAGRGPWAGPSNPPPGGPPSGPWPPDAPPAGHWPAAPGGPGGPGGPNGPGQPGPQAPGGPTTRPEPDPAATRAAARQVLHFGLLLLAAVLASTLPLPWQVGALGFVVAAMVVGVRALARAWRAGVRGAVIPMLALGLFSAGLVALTVLSLLVVWPQQLARQECLATAVTISATERCEAEFRRAVEQRFTPARPSGA